MPPSLQSVYATFTTVCLDHLHYSLSRPPSLQSVYAIFTTVCLDHLHYSLSMSSSLQSVYAIFTTFCPGHLHYSVSRPSLLHILHTLLNFLTCVLTTHTAHTAELPHLQWLSPSHHRHLHVFGPWLDHLQQGLQGQFDGFLVAGSNLVGVVFFQELPHCLGTATYCVGL